MNMVNGIWQSMTSFLSAFKTFFFQTSALLIFGSALLFLCQPLCKQGYLCNNYLGPIFSPIEIDFNKSVDIIKFLLFSYIVGLLLYIFSRLIFSKSLRGFLTKRFIQKTKTEEKDSEKRPNEIDILDYLEKHNLSKDVYTAQLFFSLIARLLFGFVAITTIFLSPPFLLLGVIVTVILFFLNFIADNEVNSLGNQIKDIIKDEKQKT